MNTRERCPVVQSKVGRTRDTGVQERQHEHVTRETHASLKSRDFFPIEAKEDLFDAMGKTNFPNDRKKGVERKSSKHRLARKPTEGKWHQRPGAELLGWCASTKRMQATKVKRE